MKFRSGVVAMTIAILAAALIAPLAQGKGQSFKSTVSIDGYTEHYFGSGKGSLQGYDVFGHFSALKNACKAGRGVVVFLKVDGPDTPLGRDTSDSNGGWSLFVPGNQFDTSGTYYAKAPKRKLGHGKKCAPVRSGKFVAFPPV